MMFDSLHVANTVQAPLELLRQVHPCSIPSPHPTGYVHPDMPR
jgi:hypothetical protein